MRNDKERRNSERVLNQLYTRIESVDLSKCFYCDDARETLDHCPPLKLATYLDIGAYRRTGGKFLLIPACSKCNSILGAKPLLTPLERLHYLSKAYLKFLRDFNRDWSEDDMDELGPNLRSMIEGREQLARMYEKKLNNVVMKFAECEEESFAAV